MMMMMMFYSNSGLEHKKRRIDSADYKFLIIIIIALL